MWTTTLLAMCRARALELTQEGVSSTTICRNGLLCDTGQSVKLLALNISPSGGQYVCHQTRTQLHWVACEPIQLVHRCLLGRLVCYLGLRHQAIHPQLHTLRAMRVLLAGMVSTRRHRAVRLRYQLQRMLRPAQVLTGPSSIVDL